MHYDILSLKKGTCEVTCNPLVKTVSRTFFLSLFEHHIQGIEINRKEKQSAEFAQLLK